MSDNLECKWALWPPDAFARASDEFMVGTTRVRLHGSSLTIMLDRTEPEDTLIKRAEALAREYVARLAKNAGTQVSVFSYEELAALPGSVSSPAQGAAASDLDELDAALRTARNETVPSSEKALRQSYDYMQNACAHADHSLRELYKMVETIENELGGEAAAASTLNAKTEIKFIKRLANEDRRDERHPPKNSTNVLPPSAEDRAKVMETARRLLRFFELHISKKSAQGAP